MYFVDRRKIDKTLLYLDELLLEFNNHTFESKLEKLSLERLVHMMIESILDVGNMMIDGFIMRDPGSYEDIIDILVDEKVLPKQYQNDLKEVIGLRNIVVRDYLNIDHHYLEKIVRTHKRKLNEFTALIRTYLDQELGVAH